MDGSCGPPTFACFSALPKELRDKIWDFAIQNQEAKPQAHFFHFTGDEQDILYDFHTAPRTAIWDEAKLALGPPTWNTSTHSNRYPLWSDPGNPSAYLCDTGIWNACVESRGVVVRRWWKCHRSDPGFRADDVYGATTIRLAEGSSERWITTRPQHDLHVLQIPNLASSIGRCIQDTWRGAIWRFSYGENLGVEYDPQWMEELKQVQEMRGPVWMHLQDRETPLGGLAREITVLDSELCLYLWLVDNSLRPVDDISYHELVAGREVFTAKDRQYIEVELDDIGTRWWPVEGKTFRQTAVAFEDELYPDLKDHYSDNNYLGDSPREYFDRLSLRVVTCLREDWLKR